MQSKTDAESIRSRLAGGHTVRLGEITVSVIQDDPFTSFIFAVATYPANERPWRYQIDEPGRTHTVGTIDDVLAYLAARGMV